MSSASLPPVQRITIVQHNVPYRQSGHLSIYIHRTDDNCPQSEIGAIWPMVYEKKELPLLLLLRCRFGGNTRPSSATRTTKRQRLNTNENMPFPQLWDELSTRSSAFERPSTGIDIKRSSNNTRQKQTNILCRRSAYIGFDSDHVIIIHTYIHTNIQYT